MLKDYLALPLSHSNHPVQLQTQKNSSIILGSLASSRLNQHSSIDQYDAMLGESYQGSASRGPRLNLNSPSGLDHRPLMYSPAGVSALDMTEDGIGDF